MIEPVYCYYFGAYTSMNTTGWAVLVDAIDTKSSHVWHLISPPSFSYEAHEKTEGYVELTMKEFIAKIGCCPYPYPTLDKQ